MTSSLTRFLMENSTNLEEWKKAYFNEVVTSAKNGIQSIEIDGKNIQQL